MQQFLNQMYFNNTILDYLIFAITLILSCVAIRITEYFIFRRLNAWAKKDNTPIDYFLVRGFRKYILPITYLAVINLTTKILNFSPFMTKIIDTVIMAVIAIIGAMFVSSVAVFIFNKYWENKTKDVNNELALNWIGGIAKVVIWSIALLLFLDNIGFKVTSLVAGLGIGGLALAFASQAILADIFCFFTIFFDKPFELGDFIVSGDQMGTVEHIGMKTTRLRALSGEQIIFSNTDLTSSRIRNFKTMEQRRVLFTLIITYDTKYEILKEIPNVVKNIIDNVPETTFGRTHFYSYGAYGLNFEIAYFVLTSDYDKYMDINQEINLRIKEEFDKRRIQFALPTQTLHLQSSSCVLGSDPKTQLEPKT